MADEKKTEETTEEAPEVEAVAGEAVADGEADGSDLVEDQVAEADVPAAPAAEESAGSEAGTAQPESKKKKRRLPRALRPTKTRPRRPVSSGKRKPIAPATRPSDVQRGRRQERRGVVVSNAMDKTIVVKVDVIKSHPRYKKVVRRSVKFHAHDEQNAANVGDVVRIVETRPLSATKRWRLAEIVEAAK